MAIRDNLEFIRKQISIACEEVGRSIDEITIVAVTKSVGTEKAIEVVESGVLDLGENRIESMLEKYSSLGAQAKWHFIGSLQSRKVKDIINIVDYVHSLDRLSLAEEIQKRARKKVQCFLEVKTSTEQSKQGVERGDAIKFIQQLKPLDKIEVVGLMTMAPLTTDKVEIRRCFQSLCKLQKEIQNLRYDFAPCTELSMGMSNDYDIAIQEGATFIRLGTVLVGTT